MLFNSIPFLIFFPVVTLLFFLLPHRFRWMLLLAASCFFYMFFKPEYILILAFTIVIDYYMGILLEDEQDEDKRRSYLILSFVANIGVLAVFKYYNFFNDNITGLASLFGFKNHLPYLKMLLPIGLSFHTFQAMSYTIEVYRGNQKAERHFGIYSLYVMFYPQLVAGPIERPQNVIHQFYTRQKFDYGNAVTGLNLIAYGLFKKMVIADRLSEYVSQVYNNWQNASTLSTLLACYFFSIQIYCDFSGYSDIARGTAKFMGFDLMVNFNRPFLSESISEFWQRWHISLSGWFYDYVFNPLAASLRSWRKWAIVAGLLITFFLSGFWHGADWKYIIWGLIYGVALVYEFFTKNFRKKIFATMPVWLNTAISRFIVFHFFVLASVFFRAADTKQAINIFRKLFEFNCSTNIIQLSAGRGPFSLLLDVFVIAILALSYLLPSSLIMKKNLLFLVVTTLVIIILGKDSKAEFIYFQF
jgi:alginate O-acetyltransferase complex protein AlgI